MIEYIENEDGRFVEIHIKDKITVQDIDGIWTKLDARAREWGKIKVLKRFDTFPGIEMSAVWHNVTNGIKKISSFGSAAIVTDKQWIETLSKVIGPVTGKNVKCFSSDQLQEARAWLGSQPS